MDLVSQQREESTISTSEASKIMCISSLRVGGIKKGFRQVTKSIIGGRSKLVIVSKSINEQKMIAVLDGLIKQYNVPVLKVTDHNELAIYVGICKPDETGKIDKDAKCAVASIEDFGKDIEGKEVLFRKLGLAK